MQSHFEQYKSYQSTESVIINGIKTGTLIAYCLISRQTSDDSYGCGVFRGLFVMAWEICLHVLYVCQGHTFFQISLKFQKNFKSIKNCYWKFGAQLSCSYLFSLAFKSARTSPCGPLKVICNCSPFSRVFWERKMKRFLTRLLYVRRMKR